KAPASQQGLSRDRVPSYQGSAELLRSGDADLQRASHVDGTASNHVADLRLPVVVLERTLSRVGHRGPLDEDLRVLVTPEERVHQCRVRLGAERRDQEPVVRAATQLGVLVRGENLVDLI